MPKGILRSVGKGGSNDRRDVRLVQIYLNSFIKLEPPQALLTEDGLAGAKTISAIRHFQSGSVGMTFPDGRVDPNGKTFRYLTMYFTASEQEKIEQGLTQRRRTSEPNTLTHAKIRSRAGLNDLLVSYHTNVSEAKRIVSSYCLDAIRLALKEAGMDRAVITSTFRTPREQADIMLRNAKKDLASQYQLYGANGDEVLRVYEKNKSKSDAEIASLMTRKIEELATAGKRVSKHCVSASDYKSLNIIDLGLNSTRAACKNFNAVNFTGALKELFNEGYLERIIDETRKSNSCWHLEIRPNKKSIPNYNKSSILPPAKHLTVV